MGGNRDPPALQEKSVIKHEPLLNFLKWGTGLAPTVTWCADSDLLTVAFIEFNSDVGGFFLLLNY